MASFSLWKIAPSACQHKNHWKKTNLAYLDSHFLKCLFCACLPEIEREFGRNLKWESNTTIYKLPWKSFISDCLVSHISRLLRSLHKKNWCNKERNLNQKLMSWLSEKNVSKISCIPCLALCWICPHGGIQERTTQPLWLIWLTTNLTLLPTQNLEQWNILDLDQ